MEIVLCCRYLDSLMWRKGQPLFRQACELAFTECHADRNHYISEQEVHLFFLFLDILLIFSFLNQYEIHELFKLFDTDNDGKISKDDFSTCLRRNPLLITLFSPKLIHKNLSEGGDKMLKEIV
ncbi:Lysophospholipid acyltransferase LPEAT2 [Camellia lanceoleosa]|uniref:Lysophospholipid acyltransferase LPEAT2 n=1 Tax=Camellia lanceoleosa TaxID=1840588 RepID=A0ACC0IA04_9ERIC|nr:Lysophospholipid acyltransferase LPEAT2 [Camellia lanceoleosa]